MPGAGLPSAAEEGTGMTSTIGVRARDAVMAIALVIFAAAHVFAQGSATSSITGTVVDTSAAGVPGADVTATNTANGTVFRAVSSDNGAFTIPAVPTGTYSVNVALQGFKTAILKDVIVSVAG